MDSVTVDAGPDATICRTDGITLTPTSYGLGYKWSPAASLSNPDIKNPIATPLVPLQTYTVIANVGKCTAQDVVNIKTIPYPQANAGQDTTICYNTPAVLHGSIVGATYNWSPPATIGNPRSLTTTVTPLRTTFYVLTVFDTLGCPKPFRDTVLVTVRERIVVNAGNDTSVIYNQPLQLNATANATDFTWTPALGLSTSEAPDPVLLWTPEIFSGEQVTYTVRASTAEGCQATDNIIVRLFKTGPTIFVPSAFTPGNDQLNDVIRPILAGMRQLDYFRIFNRYGQLVFETKMIGKGWDGRIKGELQGSNSYVYMCQAVDYLGKVVQQKGSFALIR